MKFSFKYFSLVVFAILLGGCTEGISINGNGTRNQIIHLLVSAIKVCTNKLSTVYNLSFGSSLVLVIIIIKIFLLPITLYSSVDAVNQKVKLKLFEEEIELIKSKISQSRNVDERRKGYDELKKFNRLHGMKNFSFLPILLLLIQLPILSSLFLFMKGSAEISGSIIFGINLNERNVIITILVVTIYVLQSYLTSKSIQKGNKTVLLINPLMMLVLSYSSPAILGIYWIISGVFACIQMFIKEYIIEPVIIMKSKKK